MIPNQAINILIVTVATSDKLINGRPMQRVVDVRVDLHLAHAGELLFSKQDVHDRLDDGGRILIGELAC